MLSLNDIDTALKNIDPNTSKELLDTFNTYYCSKAQYALLEQGRLEKLVVSSKKLIDLEDRTYCNAYNLLDIIRISAGVMEYAMRQMMHGAEINSSQHITIKFSNKECVENPIYGGSDYDAIRIFGYCVFIALISLVDDGMSLPPLYEMKTHADT